MKALMIMVIIMIPMRTWPIWNLTMMLSSLRPMQALWLTTVMVGMARNLASTQPQLANNKDQSSSMPMVGSSVLRADWIAAPVDA